MFHVDTGVVEYGGLELGLDSNSVLFRMRHTPCAVIITQPQRVYMVVHRVHRWEQKLHMAHK